MTGLMAMAGPYPDYGRFYADLDSDSQSLLRRIRGNDTSDCLMAAVKSLIDGYVYRDEDPLRYPVMSDWHDRWLGKDPLSTQGEVPIMLNCPRGDRVGLAANGVVQAMGTFALGSPTKGAKRRNRIRVDEAIVEYLDCRGIEAESRDDPLIGLLSEFTSELDQAVIKRLYASFGEPVTYDELESDCWAHRAESGMQPGSIKKHLSRMAMKLNKSDLRDDFEIERPRGTNSVSLIYSK